MSENDEFLLRPMPPAEALDAACRYIRKAPWKCLKPVRVFAYESESGETVYVRAGNANAEFFFGQAGVNTLHTDMHDSPYMIDLHTFSLSMNTVKLCFRMENYKDSNSEETDAAIRAYYASQGKKTFNARVRLPVFLDKKFGCEMWPADENACRKITEGLDRICRLAELLTSSGKSAEDLQPTYTDSVLTGVTLLQKDDTLKSIPFPPLKEAPLPPMAPPDEITCHRLKRFERTSAWEIGVLSSCVPMLYPHKFLDRNFVFPSVLDERDKYRDVWDGLRALPTILPPRYACHCYIVQEENIVNAADFARPDDMPSVRNALLRAMLAHKLMPETLRVSDERLTEALRPFAESLGIRLEHGYCFDVFEAYRRHMSELLTEPADLDDLFGGSDNDPDGDLPF